MESISDGGTGRPRRSLFSNPAFVACVCICLTVFVQLWFDTAGLICRWPKSTPYYPVMADSFLHGQVSMRVPIRPGLLELSDPYDPAANERLRWHDAVLFDGKYFLYWGPVPGLFTAVVCAVLRISALNLNDQMLVFAFTAGMTAAAAILICQIRAASFPNVGPWNVLIPIVSFGLGTPVLKAFSVYGAAIASAQFFLLAGIAAAWIGLSSARGVRIGMLIAGICWALCVGSRISLVPAVGAIVLMILHQFWKGDFGGRRIACAVALTLPLVIGSVALGGYNYVRFHNAFEFGLRYQLAGANQHAMAASDFMSPRFIPANLLNYLFPIPLFRRDFPNVVAVPWHWPAAITKLPVTYHVEQVVGLLWLQPFLLLSLVWRKRDRSSIFRRKILWVAALLGIAPALMMGGATLRYVLDAVPCLSVLAAMGYFQLLTRFDSRRVWIKLAALVLVLAQSAMAAVLTISGPEIFPATNPDLCNSIQSFLTFH